MTIERNIAAVLYTRKCNVHNALLQSYMFRTSRKEDILWLPNI